MTLGRDADRTGSAKPRPAGARLRRLVFAVAAVLVCAPPLPGLGLVDKAPLGAAWVALIAGLSVRGRVRSTLSAVAALLVLGGWAVHPAAWVWGALMLVLALGLQAAWSRGSDRPRAFAFVAAGVALGAPLLLGAAILLTADVGAGVLGAQLEQVWPRELGGRAALVANGLGVWVSFAVLVDTSASSHKARSWVGALVLGGLALLVAIESTSSRPRSGCRLGTSGLSRPIC